MEFSVAFLKMDRMSIERMCTGREFQVEGADTEKAQEEVASNTGWSGKEICIGRTQGSGRKIVRQRGREVERLRGMKYFPGSETQFVGNTMTNR